MELRYLRSRIRLERIHLKVKEGELFAAPKVGIPEDLRSAIAAHWEALMADVLADPDPRPTCCLCSAPLPVGRVYLCAACQDAAAMKAQEETHGLV